jgi:hypothetical protein
MSLISEFFEGTAQFAIWARVYTVFVIDSTLGSYSVPGIDFSPLISSKTLAPIAEMDFGKKTKDR